MSRPSATRAPGVRNRFVPPSPDSEIELAAGRADDDDLVLRSPTGTALNHRNVAMRGVEAAAEATQDPVSIPVA
jgi:hypothetical protein